MTRAHRQRGRAETFFAALEKALVDRRTWPTRLQTVAPRSAR